MMRTYLGQVPSLAEGWKQINRYTDDEGIAWLVFRRSQEHTPDWSTYKVVAEGRALRKANYWLVRNDRTGQIGFARDYVSMRTNRPKLHEHVERILKGIK
jgi:hypothetical protein